MAARAKEEDSPFKPQAAVKTLRDQVAELDIEKQVELARAVRVACREVSSDELLATQIALEVSKVVI